MPGQGWRWFQNEPGVDAGAENDRVVGDGQLIHLLCGSCGAVPGISHLFGQRNDAPTLAEQYFDIWHDGGKLRARGLYRDVWLAAVRHSSQVCLDEGPELTFEADGLSQIGTAQLRFPITGTYDLDSLLFEQHANKRRTPSARSRGSAP